MFWLQEHAEAVAEHAEQAQEHAEQVPIIVKLVNHYFGHWAYNFEMSYTYPLWKRFLAKFGTTPEAAFVARLSSCSPGREAVGARA